MILEVLPVGPIECNCVLLGCEKTREALVIDPGGDLDAIMARLDHHGLRIRALLLTHAHFDHLLAIGDLQAARGGEIMLHPGDLPLYEKVGMQGQQFGFKLPAPPPPDAMLADGQIVAWGELQGRILHTPGHSPGSVCLYVEREHLVITGDTLFAQGIGRTDLWGGSHPTLMHSIKEHLLSLPDETHVIPGHGAVTTIGLERESNPFLAELT